MQENDKCSLSAENDETVNFKKIKCCKVAEKEAHQKATIGQGR